MPIVRLNTCLFGNKLHMCRILSESKTAMHARLKIREHVNYYSVSGMYDDFSPEFCG